MCIRCGTPAYSIHRSRSCVHRAIEHRDRVRKIDIHTVVPSAVVAEAPALRNGQCCSLDGDDRKHRKLATDVLYKHNGDRIRHMTVTYSSLGILSHVKIFHTNATRVRLHHVKYKAKC